MLLARISCCLPGLPGFPTTRPDFSSIRHSSRHWPAFQLVGSTLPYLSVVDSNWPYFSLDRPDFHSIARIFTRPPGFRLPTQISHKQPQFFTITAHYTRNLPTSQTAHYHPWMPLDRPDFHLTGFRLPTRISLHNPHFTQLG